MRMVLHMQFDGLCMVMRALAADATGSVSRLEDALAQLQAASIRAAASHTAAMASRDNELQQLQAASTHAQDLLADVRASYSSLQERHRDFVQQREVLATFFAAWWHPPAWAQPQSLLQSHMP